MEPLEQNTITLHAAFFFPPSGIIYFLLDPCSVPSAALFTSMCSSSAGSGLLELLFGRVKSSGLFIGTSSKNLKVLTSALSLESYVGECAWDAGRQSKSSRVAQLLTLALVKAFCWLTLFFLQAVTTTSLERNVKYQQEHGWSVLRFTSWQVMSRNFKKTRKL